MTLAEFAQKMNALPNTPRYPVLFVGHGNPMNALLDNSYTQGWGMLGKSLPRPKAILSISAHWLTDGTKVHVSEHPKTIYSFSGFPKELSTIEYNCPGSPLFATLTKQALMGTSVLEDTEWGIDHGTWVVLRHMFPHAHIPVYQMSIDVHRTPRAHYELGAQLQLLREKGVLIMGSGNLVHNLGQMSWEENAAPLEWAERFDTKATELLTDGNHDALIAYEQLGADAMLSIPAPDHYSPLLYIIGLQMKGDGVSFPVQGIAHGSVSMRTMLIN